MSKWIWYASKGADYWGGGMVFVDLKKYGSIYRKKNFLIIGLLRRWSALDSGYYASKNWGKSWNGEGWGVNHQPMLIAEDVAAYETFDEKY